MVGHRLLSIRAFRVLQTVCYGAQTSLRTGPFRSSRYTTPLAGYRSMLALYFIGAIIWGSLAAQFFVQTLTSLSIAIVYLYGLLCSAVKRKITATGFAAAVAQASLFGALFVGGFFLIAEYFQPSGWTINMSAGFVAFVLTFVYCFIQVPDRILVAKLTSTVPYFAERARWLAPNRRISGEEARRILAELHSR